MDKSQGFLKFRINGNEIQASQRVDQSAKRKRAHNACDHCRTKKKRCDQQYPRCGACSRSKIQCTVSNRDQASPLPRDHMRALEARLKWLEQTVQETTGLDVFQIPTGTQICEERQDLDQGWWCPGPYAMAPSEGHLDTASRNIPSQDERLSNVNEVFSKNIDHRISTRRSSELCEPMLLPSFENASTCVNQYFDSLGFQYPFLERPGFIKNMQQLYEGSVDDDFHYFYHITVAISMLIGSNDKAAAEKFYQASKTSLSHVLRREDLTALRALLSLVLYSLFSTSGPSVWHTLGACLRLVTSMGLQKSKKAESQDEIKQTEQEKRCFWSVYALDRLISITFGRPLGLADEDITVELPREYNDQWIETKKSCYMSISLQAIKLRRIFSRIYQSLYREPQNDDTDVSQIILGFRKELDTWRIEAPLLPWAIHYTTSYFDYLYYTTLILLYRPNRLNPSPNADCIVGCGDASIQVIRAYYDAYLAENIKWIPLTLCQIYASGLTLLWCIEQVVKASIEGFPSPWNVEMPTIQYGIDAASELMKEFEGRRKGVDRLATKFQEQSRSVMEKAKMCPAFEVAGISASGFDDVAFDEFQFNPLMQWFDDELGGVYAL